MAILLGRSGTILSIFLAMISPKVGICQTNNWVSEGFPQEINRSPTGFISTDDILKLRDLGGMQLSPDGLTLAFSVREADAATNRYFIRWYVMPADGSESPMRMDFDGGQPIPIMHLGVPQAAIPDSQPAWSPDSTRFAVRRMEGDRIELWVIDAHSRKSIAISDGASQVTSFAWASNDQIVYQTGLNVARYKAALDAEAKNGWLWDGRIAHSTGRLLPMVPDCSSDPENGACDGRTWVFDLANGERSIANASNEKLSRDVLIRRVARRSDGSVAQFVPTDPEHQNAGTPMQQVSTTAKFARACRARGCLGARFKALGWAPGSKAIWFVKADSDLGRDDGAPGDQAALYKWWVNSGHVKEIYRIDGTLESCQGASDGVICIEERAKQPGKIVAISLSNGSRRILADPNPELKYKIFPMVDRIIINDDTGPYFAQLIYPPNFNPKIRYPLVVTQYSERGFLRGQVGNEYPIYPMSAEGFFVLSVNWSRPPNDLTVKDINQLNVEYSSSGREVVRRVIQKALEATISKGVIDEHRIAITGLSAGAEMVNFILQRSNRFRAAIASSGSQDATFFALAPEGPLRDRLMGEFGANAVFDPGNRSLQAMSWSSQPEKLSTPLLINVGEYEALLGFEGTQALVHSGAPVELRIFPDEEHIKYHPITYKGIYENNLRWLKYWLKGEVDPAPSLRAQYARWGKMSSTVTKFEKGN